MIDSQRSSRRRVDFSKHRLMLGLVSSIVSKLAAFGTQILAIPIAIQHCGLETYALYLSLVAASLAPSILLLRLGPSFVATVSKYHHQDNRPALAAYFRNSIGLTLLNCMAAGLLSVLAVMLLPVDYYFSELSGQQQSVLPALAALSAINIVACFLATVESFQAGLHETHVLYARSTISNLISTAMLFLLVPSYPTLSSLVLILQVVPFATRILNTILFIYRQRATLLLSTAKVQTNILSDGLRFTFTAGFCAYLGFQAPLLILTTHTDAALAGLYAVAMQVVLQMQGVVTVIMTPTIPTIAHSQAAGNMNRVRLIKQTCMWAVHLLGISAILGALVLSQWPGLALGIDASLKRAILSSAAILFWSMAFESVLITLLLTITAGEVHNAVYWLQGIRSILIASLAALLTSLELAPWVFIAIAGSVVVTSIVPMRILLQQQLSTTPTSEKHALLS